MSTPIFTNLTKHDVCLKVLTFTPDSSLSPPHQEDSEDESSFMTHTQVDDQCDNKLIDHQYDDKLIDDQHDENHWIPIWRIVLIPAPGRCDGGSDKAGDRTFQMTTETNQKYF